MWKIGSVKVQGRVVLAPMAGYTNLAYREFMKPFGVALTYTEMISDCGLVYKNQETYRYLATSEKERPIGIQLFGGRTSTLVKAIEIIESMHLTYDLLDINLGCPMPKVTKTGAGSAWLKRPEELYETMKAVVTASSKPVTAKIRIGWDSTSINVMEVIAALEKAGVSMIAVHARTTKQIYSGKPNYELLKNLRDKMSVPLVISGDIFTLDDAINALEITKAEAVMVARGALGNPWLVTQINEYLKTGVRLPDATLVEQIGYLKSFALKLVALKGENLAIRELKGIATHFLIGFPGMKPVKVALTTKMTTLRDLYAILDEIPKTAFTTNNEVNKL
ncbi:MAG: tRNA dihydrouridine synthase DusB [Firmicutes bacterium]|nr:tRNA dihydrouridine synthase DusB [Bacillota bacterium]